MDHLYKTDVIKLNNGRKILLKKGAEWHDSYTEEILVPVLHNVNLPGIERVNSSVNSRVWKTKRFPRLFIKLFTPRGIKDKLVFRKSRARRAAEGGILLMEKGFLAPAVVAEADVRSTCSRTESLLITREIEGSFDVYSYIDNFFEQDTSPKGVRDKRSAIEALGSLIGRLHREGIFHGDLRPGNILVTQSGKSPVFHFIDNERNKRFSGGLPEYYRLKNLVQINMIVSSKISFMDRLRFFKIYLSQNPELAPFAKDLLRRVHLMTKKRLSEKIPGIWESPCEKKN